jgi:hypothetical protein
MDFTSFRKLLTPKGQQALQDAMQMDPREADFLPLFTALSRRYSPETARAALEIAILRKEAAAKFPFAERMYFTREALEQASAYPVSAYRSQRYRPYKRLADLGCSVGGDTLALAGQAPTTGVDRDPLRLAMARLNLAALGLASRTSFLQADLNQAIPLGASEEVALFFDPARRSGQRRAFSVANYQPPLAVIQTWLAHFPSLGVKISPGVDLAELQAYDAEVEFISLQGDLKEAALWFGPLKTVSRRATLLPGPHTLTAVERPGQGRLLPVDQPRQYLYEPDAAVLRAGLVQDLGVQLQAAQLDEDIAYLTSHSLIHTPFARVWPVEDWFPFQLKELRSALRARRVGRVVVKKRGSPLQPEALIRDLRLKGDHERVIFLTHLRGRPIVILSRGEIND